MDMAFPRARVPALGVFFLLLCGVLTGCLGGSGSDRVSWPGSPDMPDIDEDRILPVIFVHGTAGSASQYQTQAMRFASNGYPEDHVVAYEYSTAGAVEINRALTGGLSGDLDGFVDNVLAEFGADQVYLACHSLGTAVCGYYVANPDREAKVAGYVAIDGATGESCPGDSNCMGLFVDETRRLGEVNAYVPDETHVQAATSEASFAAQFEFFTGVEPVRTEILPQRDEVEIAGRAVYFPANTGAAGTTLQVWEIDPDTGERLEAAPLDTFSITANGNWGPVTLDPTAYYEFQLLRPGRSEHHFYRQPLIRNSALVRLNTSQAGSVIEENTNASDDHASLVISRDMEWWGDRGTDNDLLEISTTSLLWGDQPAVNIIDPAIGSRNIGIHVHDDEATPAVTTGDPLPYFPEQPFQWGVDVYMPASTPADGVISVVSTPRGDTDNKQTLNVPNLPSSQHRISLTFNDYVQD
ncbi:alpha/beta hydrolase [Pseudomonas sp. G11-1]|uniref:Alpha/beta hydrolase n=1 Tax=Halopseudomonas bauzanensis TaxID=653930 RepID=A0A1I4NLS3_9GAMM|nr:alpha/beta fold hydrolase [Halopseudomonas bauzanensis]MCO5786342.1 alpha/beta hydrolase [Pseudomonas sp. G11-1]MCO5789568.1 alpha/beta hydrolase [Pseudomonas sp. G11-2]SES19616.1 hypothetical protein SAMN05216589_2656 [Halopseudomonas bauzanensis]SFM16315.1 hypothetical protein SAMN04487855_2563 [Halopseudomonas bauzanensis]